MNDKKHLVVTRFFLILLLNLRWTDFGNYSGDGTLSVLDVRSNKSTPFAQSEDQEDELLSIVAIKGYVALPSISRREQLDPSQGRKIGCWHPTRHLVRL